MPKVANRSKARRTSRGPSKSAPDLQLSPQPGPSQPASFAMRVLTPSVSPAAFLELHAMHDLPKRLDAQPSDERYLDVKMELSVEREVEITVEHVEYRATGGDTKYPVLSLTASSPEELDLAAGLLAWCCAQLPGMLAAQQAVGAAT